MNNSLYRRIVASAFVVGVFLGAPGLAAAQSFPPATAAQTAEAAPLGVQDKRPWFGGLGYASVGPFFGSMSGLVSALGEPAALGPSYNVPRAGLFIGGGGGAVLFERLWVGGKGFTLLMPTPNTSRGETSLGSGGAGLDLGFVIHPGQGALLIPFLGLTSFVYDLDVKNKSAASLPIESDIAIAPGTTENFSAQLMVIEAGARFHSLFFFGGTGGLTVGLEAGFMISPMSGAWTHEEKALDENEGARLTGGYLRLNLGGGGFIYR